MPRRRWRTSRNLYQFTAKISATNVHITTSISSMNSNDLRKRGEGLYACGLYSPVPFIINVTVAFPATPRKSSKIKYDRNEIKTEGILIESASGRFSADIRTTASYDIRLCSSLYTTTPLAPCIIAFVIFTPNWHPPRGTNTMLPLYNSRLLSFVTFLQRCLSLIGGSWSGPETPSSPLKTGPNAAGICCTVSESVPENAISPFTQPTTANAKTNPALCTEPPIISNKDIKLKS
mmetsp:Transcript_14951/g.26144  ORF Transcript_14951/g.26144 Transcript_14951/m.26144 type:complete len:234 (+) Transcript_14951:2781-3482(+)